MYGPLSDNFLKVIRQPHRFRNIVEYSNDAGLTWLPMVVTAGSVNADRTSSVRWSASVTCSSAYPIEPTGTQVRIYRLVSIPRAEEVVIPWGRYRVDVGSEPVGDSLALELYGMEKQIQDSRFLKPRSMYGSFKSLTESLVGEVVKDVSFLWRNKYSSYQVPRFIEERDRWGALDGGGDSPSLARSFGAEMYFDGSGSFVIGVVPTLSSPIVWDAGSLTNGIVIGPSVVRTREGLYNVVVASNVSQGFVGYGAVTEYAWDRDPGSPTYAGPDPVRRPYVGCAPFGLIPRYYTSPLITSQLHARLAAASILSNSLGVRKKLALAVSSNPALEPGDVITAGDSRYLLDKWSCDLHSSLMSLEVRTSREADGDQRDDTLPSGDIEMVS